MKNIEKFYDEIQKKLDCETQSCAVCKVMHNTDSCGATKALYNSCRDCRKESFKWLNQEAIEPVYLTRFEYDSLNLFEEMYENFEDDLWCMAMKEKGYFKGVTDTSMSIRDILKNHLIADEKPRMTNLEKLKDSLIHERQESFELQCELAKLTCPTKENFVKWLLSYDD